MSHHDLADEILIPLIDDILTRHVRNVRDKHGPLPRLRSPEFADASEPVKLAVLILAGTSWLWGPPSSTILRDAARDVRGTTREFSPGGGPSFAELQHLRGLRFDADTQRWVAA
jgi:hypothetical protein